MKILFLCFLTFSCTHLTRGKQTPIEEDLVTVRTALDQAQMSYLRGCVEAFRELKLGPSFEGCAEKARGHRLELNQIMETNVE